MFRRFILPFIALALPVVACSVSEDASHFALTGGDAGELPETPESFGSAPVDSSVAATVTGSPLCGIVMGHSCSPDLLADCVHPDGGAQTAGKSPDASISTGAAACRVATQGEPVCPINALNAETTGVDGVACETGDNCAPGFDCVYAEKGAVCRRYCCSGSCDGVTSQNGGPTFCDVQLLVPSTSNTHAPACMPIKTCTLFHDGDCANNETCGVINDKGATGCVANGGKKAGDSCENEHCRAGGTCLGSQGDRTCYKLCRTSGATDCEANETCTTGSAFQDTSYGVCKKAAQ